MSPGRGRRAALLRFVCSVSTSVIATMQLAESFVLPTIHHGALVGRCRILSPTRRAPPPSSTSAERHSPQNGHGVIREGYDGLIEQKRDPRLGIRLPCGRWSSFTIAPQRDDQRLEGYIPNFFRCSSIIGCNLFASVYRKSICPASASEPSRAQARIAAFTASLRLSSADWTSSHRQCA